MLEVIILGIVQGIAEWLPVSSEGMIFLIKTNFFGGGDFIDIARLALFLHLGTFLAALVYFRKEVAVLLRSLINYNKAGENTKKILNFLIVSTLISGVLGLFLLKVFESMEAMIIDSTRFITLMIGVLLLITAFLQFKAKKGELEKDSSKIEKKDGIKLGIVQGFAALPGLSRSGLTVSALLLRKFNEETALKLSFLMSLPIVLGGNIILNLNNFSFNSSMLVGLVFSFVFGLITIDILLKFARKVNFTIFILMFAILTIFSVFI